MDGAIVVLSWGLCGFGLFWTVLGNRKNRMQLVRLGVIASTANVILCLIYLTLRISVLTVSG